MPSLYWKSLPDASGWLSLLDGFEQVGTYPHEIRIRHNAGQFAVLEYRKAADTVAFQALCGLANVGLVFHVSNVVNHDVLDGKYRGIHAIVLFPEEGIGGGQYIGL